MNQWESKLIDLTFWEFYRFSLLEIKQLILGGTD